MDKEARETTHFLEDSQTRKSALDIEVDELNTSFTTFRRHKELSACEATHERKRLTFAMTKTNKTTTATEQTVCR